MADWLAQYTAALDERDAREQLHRQYIDACELKPWTTSEDEFADARQDTRLANRTTASLVESQSQPQDSAAPEKPSSPGPVSADETTKGKSSAATSKEHDPTNPNDLLSRLRADLSITQKARSALQARVDDLTSSFHAAEQQSKSSASQIALLTRQKTEVERRLRDRDEELRGKTKLAEEAQDEMIALGLQLNMAEQKSERLEKENNDLVERWMKRMREEVERVNRDSRWE